MGTKIPPAVIGVAATSLADYYTHANLNSLFYAAGFPGDPKEGANKVDKCLDWLRRANAESENPLALFGELIGEFMEAEQRSTAWWSGDVEKHDDHREPLKRALAKSGLSYAAGGRIIGASIAAPTLSLGERLSRGGLEALEIEYRRAYETIESDPPAAITAACAMNRPGIAGGQFHQIVRRQNIWHNSRRKLAECGPRLGVDVRRQACGVASAYVRWCVA